MKTNLNKLLSGLAVACAAFPLLAATTSSTGLPQDFPVAVQFELGDGEFEPGDSIMIQELHGTTGDIRVGETYCVTGTYTLNSQAEADLSFFATTTNRMATPIDPQQTVRVRKGTGSFRLIKRMNEEGYLHLTFYSRATGQGIGGIYFGRDPWVLHNKQFSYRESASRPEKTGATETVSSTGPNQVLFDYLGKPVAPPANLDRAYTKEGLTQAVLAAARNAGISLAKLEIDDSEYPFLVGVVFANEDDQQKLREEIRKMPAYADTGGVSSHNIRAMNLVPPSTFPTEAGQRIYRRMGLREAVLFDKVNATK